MSRLMSLWTMSQDVPNGNTVRLSTGPGPPVAFTPRPALSALPDRGVGFHAVDGFGEEAEGFAAVGGEDADEEGCLAHGDPAEAVDEVDGGAGVRGVQFAEDALELALGHGLVGFVVQAGERAAGLQLADDALELDACADLARGQSGRGDGDGAVGEGDADFHGSLVRAGRLCLPLPLNLNPNPNPNPNPPPTHEAEIKIKIKRKRKSV